MSEITYRKCVIEHIKLIKPLPGTEAAQAFMTQPEYKHVIDDHFSISAWVNNRCVAAAGIFPVFKDRAMAWAVLGADSGPYMRPITRKVKAALDLDHHKRVEMYVTTDFKEAHRWAKMLGFVCEAECLRYHGVFGQDEALYARFKT